MGERNGGDLHFIPALLCTHDAATGGEKLFGSREDKFRLQNESILTASREKRRSVSDD